MAVETLIHWFMNEAVNRFQEKADDTKWLAGEVNTDEIRLENIKRVPIALFVGTNDTICAYETALEYIPKIQSVTTRIDVEGEGHLYFALKATSQWFMDNLIAQLQVPSSAEFTQ